MHQQTVSKSREIRDKNKQVNKTNEKQLQTKQKQTKQKTNVNKTKKTVKAKYERVERMNKKHHSDILQAKKRI